VLARAIAEHPDYLELLMSPPHTSLSSLLLSSLFLYCPQAFFSWLTNLLRYSSSLLSSLLYCSQTNFVLARAIAEHPDYLELLMSPPHPRNPGAIYCERGIPVPQQ
jgi:hypothetical protein